MISSFGDLVGVYDCSPWSATTGRRQGEDGLATPLYTDEQRQRRDQSAWTTVQAVLAPVQFAAFLVSASSISCDAPSAPVTRAAT